MAPLLMHDDTVPLAARDALQAAEYAGPEGREAQLESAARALYQETDLDCGDARELVGLPPDGNCR